MYSVRGKFTERKGERMRTRIIFLAAALFAAALTIRAGEVRSAPLRERKPGQPRLERREGWLVVANQDWTDYYAMLDQDMARISLSAQNNGGYRIPSGGYLALPLDRALWEIVGDDDRNPVEVRIRPGQESDLTLVPSGAENRPGLTAMVEADGRRQSGTLFNPRPRPLAGAGGFGGYPVPGRSDGIYPSRPGYPAQDDVVGDVMNDTVDELVDSILNPQGGGPNYSPPPIGR